MATQQSDLSRRWLIEVTKSGHVFIRAKTAEPKPGEDGGLPVFSTAVKGEAEGLRIFLCRLARDGSGLYRLNRCLGNDELELDDLEAVTNEFRAAWERRRSRKSAR
jgi:hypothetical protein